MKKLTLLQATFVAASLWVASSISVQAQASDSDYKAFVGNADTPCVIVTGSNRGQGLGWVKHYLEAGKPVIATCRKPAKATELIDLSKQYKDLLLIEQLDLLNAEHFTQLEEMLEKHGVKIDLAVSNAGVTVAEEFGNWSMKGMNMNIGVNAIGAALFAQAVDPALVDGAKIIHITSGNGSTTYHKKVNNLEAYGMSKAAMNHLSKRLSVILKDRGIIVVAMTPGMVLTDMNPFGKMSVEEAVDNMAVIVEGLTLENSGTFINYKGKEMAW